MIMAKWGTVDVNNKSTNGKTNIKATYEKKEKKEKKEKS